MTGAADVSKPKYDSALGFISVAFLCCVLGSTVTGCMAQDANDFTWFLPVSIGFGLMSVCFCCCLCGLEHESSANPKLSKTYSVTCIFIGFVVGAVVMGIRYAHFDNGDDYDYDGSQHYSLVGCIFFSLFAAIVACVGLTLDNPRHVITNRTPPGETSSQQGSLLISKKYLREQCGVTIQRDDFHVKMSINDRVRLRNTLSMFLDTLDKNVDVVIPVRECIDDPPPPFEEKRIDTLRTQTNMNFPPPSNHVPGLGLDDPVPSAPSYVGQK